MKHHGRLLYVLFLLLMLALLAGGVYLFWSGLQPPSPAPSLFERARGGWHGC